jgi:hypothetical protein
MLKAHGHPERIFPKIRIPKMETSFLYLKKDFQRRTNNKIFFFVEKSPRRQRATPKVCT